MVFPVYGLYLEPYKGLPKRTSKERLWGLQPPHRSLRFPTPGLLRRRLVRSFGAAALIAEFWWYAFTV